MNAPPNVLLRLAARVDNVALVREVIAGLADAVPLGPAAEDARAAVSEACNNVVVHAYRTAVDDPSVAGSLDGDGVGPLEVDLRLSAVELEVVVRDRGAALWERPAPDDENPSSGLGLTVIEALTARHELEVTAGRGTTVAMWFSISELATPPPPPAQAPPTRPAPADGRVAISVSPPPLSGPILGRLVGALAARAGFSIDRLADAQLLTDAIAAAAAKAIEGEYVTASIEALDQRRLEVRVESLVPGGATALLAGSTIAELGAVIERLADEVEVLTGAGGEALRLLLRDLRGSAAA
jgi:serine/threonine-protein kinase RsbW